MRHLKFYLSDITKEHKLVSEKTTIGKVETIKSSLQPVPFKNVLCFRDTPKRKVQQLINFVQRNNTVKKVVWGHETLINNG